MKQPSTIYKPGKLNYIWNYLSYTINEFKVKIQGYRSYKAALVQTGTNPPVATVLENTLGYEVEYEYSSQGQYTALLNGALFDSPTQTAAGKQVEVTITPATSDNTGLYTFSAYPIFFFVVGIYAWDHDGAEYADDKLGNWCSTILEIKVYN